MFCMVEGMRRGTTLKRVIKRFVKDCENIGKIAIWIVEIIAYFADMHTSGSEMVFRAS